MLLIQLSEMFTENQNHISNVRNGTFRRIFYYFLKHQTSSQSDNLHTVNNANRLGLNRLIEPYPFGHLLYNIPVTLVAFNNITLEL